MPGPQTYRYRAVELRAGTSSTVLYSPCSGPAHGGAEGGRDRVEVVGERFKSSLGSRFPKGCPVTGRSLHTDPGSGRVSGW